MSFLTKARERFEQLMKAKTSSGTADPQAGSPQREGSTHSSKDGNGSGSRSRRRPTGSSGQLHSVLQSEFNALSPPASPKGSAKSRATSPTLSTRTDDTSHSGRTTPASRAPPTIHENAVVETLTEDTIDLEKLRRLCWGGCPNSFRAECWGVLTGYYPLTHANRVAFLSRKRSEYQSYVNSGYRNIDWDALLSEDRGKDVDGANVGVEEVGIMKQIRKDLPRAGNIRVLHVERIQKIMERVLYIWALRHPACGYVQGMNDIVYPFLFVLLVDHVAACNGRISYFCSMKTVEEAEEALGSLTDNEWQVIEADLYWNLSRVLSQLQENYTFNQAGAHAMVKKLHELMKVVDPALCRHLDRLSIQFPEFAFRWMNCLLLRELTPAQALRLWDTYLSEEDFSNFHVYVCCELLNRWSGHLQRFDDMAQALSFLQSPPTFHFHDRDLDEITSSAFVLQQTYDKSFKHLLDDKNSHDGSVGASY